MHAANKETVADVLKTMEGIAPLSHCMHDTAILKLLVLLVLAANPCRRGNQPAWGPNYAKYRLKVRMFRVGEQL